MIKMRVVGRHLRRPSMGETSGTVGRVCLRSAFETVERVVASSWSSGGRVVGPLPRGVRDCCVSRRPVCGECRTWVVRSMFDLPA